MLVGYADSSALTMVSPFSFSIYNHLYIANILHFQYRIAKNHTLTLISVSLTETGHYLLGVDRRR
ncbi:hypothetical protein FML68_00980 [Klebsiella aerogenes]|nr:hypothetical protein [Klebsiella aerogenes]